MSVNCDIVDPGDCYSYAVLCGVGMMGKKRLSD